MKKGDVWWADLGGSVGRRPVLLLSRDSAYAIRALVTVAPISRRIRGIPVEVQLGANDGLPHDCAANLDSLTTIAKDQLQRQITSLRINKIEAVNEAIRFALDLED